MTQKILIVEDEFLIALDLETHFVAAGYDVVIAATVEEALPLIDEIDMAILDFHVAGADTTPIATALRGIGKPFVVCSGRDISTLGAAFAGAENLAKPYTMRELDVIVSRMGGAT